ncbi:hypothetical protein BGZ98_007421 [Dissophora globulifera]|nr:hypothetical protein BGZ98_007421 [Dissophora globulifera]
MSHRNKDRNKDRNNRQQRNGQWSGSDSAGSSVRHAAQGGERFAGIKRRQSSDFNNSQHQRRYRDSQQGSSVTESHLTSREAAVSTQSSASAPSSSSSSSSSTSPATEPIIREIPGFYFDPEKKKYFKIIANQVFGSQYLFSQQSIKQKTEEKPVVEPIKKRNGTRFSSMPSGISRMCWFLQDYQLGLAGSPRRQLNDMHEYLAKSWRKSKSINTLNRDLAAKYTHLRIDHAKQALYLGSSEGQIVRYQLSQADAVEHGVAFNPRELLTSIHITLNNYLVSTFLGDHRSGSLRVMRGADSSAPNMSHFYPVFSYHPNKTSIWTSELDADLLLIGADERVIVIHDWKSATRVVRSLWTGSDVFSVAMNPRNAPGNIIYAGCRNGSVKIFDLDEPKIFEQFSEQRKKDRRKEAISGIRHHESSVHCMKILPDGCLVTAAMNGEIFMWDPRQVMASTLPNSRAGSLAKPLLEIRTRIPQHLAKTPFAVNHEGTLLASENLKGRLSIWSLRTGDRIKDLDVGGSVCDLEFPRDQGIWLATEDEIQFWDPEGEK